MAEDHVTTTQAPDGSTVHTTVVKSGRSGSGGAGWFIAVILLFALAAVVFIFAKSSDSQAAKDAAITEAAGEVGQAADQIGNAAQDAAESLKK